MRFRVIDKKELQEADPDDAWYSAAARDAAKYGDLSMTCKPSQFAIAQDGELIVSDPCGLFRCVNDDRYVVEILEEDEPSEQTGSDCETKQLALL